MFRSLDPSVKIAQINVFVSAPNNEAFGYLQVVLTNGMQSPALHVENTNWRIQKSLNIPFDRKVAKIRAQDRESAEWGDILDLEFCD